MFANTIGIEFVRRCSAATPGVMPLTMTSGASVTSSAAAALIRSASTPRPAEIEPDAAALVPPELLKSLTERGEAGLEFLIVLGADGHDSRHGAHAHAVARAPRAVDRRRAAESRDELAPLHSVELHFGHPSTSLLQDIEHKRASPWAARSGGVLARGAACAYCRCAPAPAAAPSGRKYTSTFMPTASASRLGEIDQDLHHVDIGHAALSARADPSRLDQRSDERHLAAELAPPEGGGAHDDRLPDLDFPEVAFVQFGPARATPTHRPATRAAASPTETPTPRSWH